MICLGIESTAHTAGVGIVRDGAVLANEIEMFQPNSGGIHPREAANHHAEAFPGLVRRAMERAGVRLGDVDAVAFAQGPGLGPCLRTGATVARALAVRGGATLVGVNHCVAHLELGDMVGAVDPVLLYVSGGNTQVIAFAGRRYRVFGETLDIGVGNMLDRFGQGLGLPFPQAPAVEVLARSGTCILPLPYSVKGMDVAFSGILTAAQAHKDRGARVEDLALSLQETVFAMLVEVTERAMAHTEKDEVLLGGGVARNERLFAMVRAMANERGARAFRPEPDLLRDNGAMIAHLGAKMAAAGIVTPLDRSGVRQRFRTDEVEVSWR